MVEQTNLQRGRSEIVVQADERSELSANNGRDASAFALAYAQQQGFPQLRISGTSGPYPAAETGATDNQLAAGTAAVVGWHTRFKLLSMP